MRIFLTDQQRHVQYHDFPHGDALKFMIYFKKIFPSITDLLLPVLPDDPQKLEDITWESSSEDFAVFKRLIQEWQVVEMRIAALTEYHRSQEIRDCIKQAEGIRKHFIREQQQLDLLTADFVFLLAIHSIVDDELSQIGKSFYLPTLRAHWQDIIAPEVLNMPICIDFYENQQDI